MLQLPKLLHFEEVDQEKRWTYQLKIIFNYQWIEKITITNYWQTKPGRDMITKELIWNIFKEKLHTQDLRPTKYQGKRKVYKWEKYYGDRKYRLFFWFKDGTDNHLWLRNIHPID